MPLLGVIVGVADVQVIAIVIEAFVAEVLGVDAMRASVEPVSHRGAHGVGAVQPPGRVVIRRLRAGVPHFAPLRWMRRLPWVLLVGHVSFWGAAPKGNSPLGRDRVTLLRLPPL